MGSNIGRSGGTSSEGSSSCSDAFAGFVNTRRDDRGEAPPPPAIATDDEEEEDDDDDDPPTNPVFSAVECCANALGIASLPGRTTALVEEDEEDEEWE